MKSFQVADFNAPLKEVDQPTPQPTGTQVLLKVKAAGVCHSDLHIWEGGYDLGHGRKPLMAESPSDHGRRSNDVHGRTGQRSQPKFQEVPQRRGDDRSVQVVAHNELLDIERDAI